MKENGTKVLCKMVFICLLVMWLAMIAQGKNRVQPDERYYIAVITKSTESAFFKSVKAGANAAATEYNVKMTFDGPKTEEDAGRQNQIIAQAAENGADAIVLSAVDYDANAGAVEEAVKKGVKVVVIDSDVNCNGVVCRIGTDDHAAGIMAGEAALDSEEEELHVGIVNYDIHTANGQEREAGFREYIGQDERVKSIETINVLSTTEDARRKTVAFLEEHPEINVIATFNEWTSLGVGWAIRDMDALDKRVIAFDNNVVSVGMLETGEVDALIVQNPYAMGYLGVESAYKILKEKQQPENIYTETTLIKRENMFLPECQKILFSFGS